MKKLTIFLFSVVLVLSQVGVAKSEVILFKDFEDSSDLILAGCVPAYWDMAPLDGTASIPSNFLQGSSSQYGNIFYGSFAKQNAASSAATMTIILPDLRGYTNLELTVALASAEPQRWEPTHRDSLRIIGNTTISPPYVDCSMSHGCQSVTGEIDIFLPKTYPDDLWSIVHSTCLGHEFQDFMYTIDSSLKSLTFAFASTALVEVIGIDSVKITGDPIINTELIAFDIKPGSCPNPLDLKKKGDLPAAILGTDELDVTTIDPSTIIIGLKDGGDGSVSPLRWAYEDVATHFEPLTGKFDCDYDCTKEKKDGYLDLTLKFSAQEVISLIPDEYKNHKECLVLSIEGKLTDGTDFYGEDVVSIRLE